MIDEGHRTQYGTFNVSMQRVFPNACFLAFTGTPLMKKERNTANKFGGYIGLPYTVKDAVKDGAVVPLLYEGRHNLTTLNDFSIIEDLNISKRLQVRRQRLNRYNQTTLYIE